MTRNDDYKLAPIRAFSAGTMKAVMWHLRDEVTKHIDAPYHKVSLQRFE